ncbi:MAG: hypothetical protein SGILL_000797 [Bacillariaceae sp.]
MTALRTVLALLLVAAAVHGFTPVHKPATAATRNTALSFGFLKELGLEKPDWLPDFGGKKEEPVAAAEPADGDAEETDDAEAAVEE